MSDRKLALFLIALALLVWTDSLAPTAHVEKSVAQTPPAYFAGNDTAETSVTFQGETWLINGVPTHQGVTWNGVSTEGQLLNSRMVNGAYDDLDGSPPSSMLPWDPEDNTREFIANMQSWKDAGLDAFNINFQGGSNRLAGLSGDEQNREVDNNPYGVTGTRAFDEWNDWDQTGPTPHSRYLQRIGSIIRHADDIGLVVNLGFFYFGQDEGLADEAAVIAATDAATDWILDNGWTNVIVEVNNESMDSTRYQHEILQPQRIAELVERVQQRSQGAPHLPAGRLLTSTSIHPGAGRVPTDEQIALFDYVIVHGNGLNASGIANTINTVRSSPSFQANVKPIVFNEDSTSIANFETAALMGVGWGYYDDIQYQSVYPSTEPDRWATDRAPVYWNKVTHIATGIAPPVPPPDLLFSSSPDRSNPVLLDGTLQTGDTYIFVENDGFSTQVIFEINGLIARIENVAPYDLAGSPSGSSLAAPFNTLTLSDGPHTMTATVARTTGTVEVLFAAFTVNNNLPLAIDLSLSPSSVPVRSDEPATITVSTSDLSGLVPDEVRVNFVHDDALFQMQNPQCTGLFAGGIASLVVRDVDDTSSFFTCARSAGVTGVAGELARFELIRLAPVEPADPFHGLRADGANSTALLRGDEIFGVPGTTNTVEVLPGTRITGKATLQAIVDPVTFDLVAPQVTLQPIAGGSPVTVQLQNDGSFEFNGVHADAYELKLTAQGYVGMHIPSFTIGVETDLNLQPVELRGGLVNHDLIVDGGDISFVVSSLGLGPIELNGRLIPVDDYVVDIDADGYVTGADISIIVSNIGLSEFQPWSDSVVSNGACSRSARPAVIELSGMRSARPALPVRGF